MGTGYTRTDAADIVDNGIINASDLNNEYNAIQAAFNGSSGHSHDGTTGEGPLLDLATSTTGTLPLNRGGTGATNIADLKTSLAINNVDNTSDANKPVSIAQNAAFDIHSKAAKTTPADADELGLVDSVASFGLKRITWLTVKNIIQTIADASSAAVLVTATNAIAAARAVANIWTAPQRYSTVAYTPNATLNLADGASRSIVLNTNTTLPNPTDISSFVGQQFSISGVQDATGSRTLAVGSSWFPIGEATMPAVPSAANAKFRIDAQVVDAARIDFKLSGVGTN